MVSSFVCASAGASTPSVTSRSRADARDIVRRIAASLYASSFVREAELRRGSAGTIAARSPAVNSRGKDRLGMIETTRLRLRRLRPEDEADLIALDSDPDVMRYVGAPAGVKSVPETLERVRQRIETDHEPLGFWRVESRADGTFYGLGALVRMPIGDDIELAYRLVRRAWGQGIASEAGGPPGGFSLRPPPRAR